MLDEIAWLFNLRGNDIPYNPVFFSYALITKDKVTIFVNSEKLDEQVKSHLGDAVSIQPYESVLSHLTEFSTSARSEGSDEKSQGSTKEKYLVSKQASWALVEALGGEKFVDEIRSPIAGAKAVKNTTELEGMRACHIRDGAALIEYFAWLEEQLGKGAEIDEVQGADELEKIRSRHKNFVGLSFDTISSTGPNAAVIHYKPERGNCSLIDPNQVYLCDSGAQYLDGTTDTTRTLHFGKPTEMEQRGYTLVLKGNIALDRAIFPKGTSGMALDTLARQFLWDQGLDYRHGTGHGVGSFLNVHEGPIGIGTKVQYSEVPLEPGNVISDEPGYYEDGSFGIRIENIVMCREAKTPFRFGDKPYYGFEHVTMVPLCRTLIDTSLLTSVEKDWLNDYHKDIYEKTSSYFQEDPRSLKWLKRETAPFEG